MRTEYGIRDMIYYDEDGNEIPDEDLPWSDGEGVPAFCDSIREWTDQKGEGGESSSDESQSKDTRSAAERRKRLAKSMREEALRRLELSARTTAEFQNVVEWYDREEKSRMRKERRYEVTQGDMLIEAILSDGGNIVPNSMGRPTFQQICRGEFDDFLANCIFRMHDLTEREYLRQIILNLKQDHKEILYFLGIRRYSVQQLADLREQSERNVRKVRGTVHRKLQKQVYEALRELDSQNEALTLQEQRFLNEYAESSQTEEENDT